MSAEPAQPDSEADTEPDQPDSEPDHADSIYVHDLGSFTQPYVQDESELQPPQPVPQHRPSLPDEITY